MTPSAGDGSNKILFWSRLSDWKNQTLTPNPDVHVLLHALLRYEKLTDPLSWKFHLPMKGPRLTGSVMDCWQCALEDVGPAGIDKGKGGKCLILPPGYSEKIPDGYIPMPSENFQGYALLRSILQTGGDTGVAKARAYAKRVKLYPLSLAANPPDTKFFDASGRRLRSKYPL